MTVDEERGASEAHCANPLCLEETRKLKTCERCRTARYCGYACQKAHWKTHKRKCGKLGT
jgi:hypothetical protein